MRLQQVSFAKYSAKDNYEYETGQWFVQDFLADTIEYTPIQKEFGQIVKLAALIELFTSVTQRNQAIESLLDALTLSDNVKRIVHEILNDSISFSDAASNILYRYDTLVDKLKLDVDIVSFSEMTSFVSAVLAYSDTLQFVLSENITDVLQLSETFYSRLTAYEVAIDTVLFSGNLNRTGFTVLLADTMQFNAEISSKAVLKSLIHDKINFFASFTLFDEEFTAYAINSQSLGISEFSNFGFNSFSYPYAATSNGIYKLDSNTTDDGEEINVSIKTGLMDFGTALKKQVPYAYLGIQEDGRVLMKAVSNNRGVKKERWYEVRSYTGALDTTRVQLGKGVKAKYWQFEITNIEGEELTLESMEVMPLILKRRKQ